MVLADGADLTCRVVRLDFYGNVLVVALMLAWDWWRGRMMRQVVIGGGALLASECLATILYFWGPWKTLTLGWVEARARYVSCCPFRSGNAPFSSVRRRP